MRIAMIGPFGLRLKGTLSVRALPMARALVRRGHAIKMIVPPWDCPADAGQSFEDAGVIVENISLPQPAPLLFHVNTTRRLVRSALAFQPDVVHCFKPKAYAGLSAWWLWQLKRTGSVQARLVVDADDWEGAGGWNDLSGYSQFQKRVFAWQERWGLTHNDGVTVASRALQSIVWSLGMKPERVAYVPNGVSNVEFGTRNPTGTLHSAESTIHNLHSAFRILLYTRFFEFKVERVLEVLRCVLVRIPDAHLLVVGRGFFGEEEQLLKQAEAMGLQEHIEYAGWVDQSALPNFFAQSNVAIYPFDDTLVNRAKCSVKLIDLLAAGIPVVADAVGQNMEYIRHGQTGLLVRSGDVAAMADAVVDLLHDQEKATRLGAYAARDIVERFSWDRLAADVEQVYGGKS